MFEPVLDQNSKENEPFLRPKGKSKLIYYGLAVLLLVAAFSAVAWFKHQKKFENSGKVLTNKDRHLSAEAKKIYQDRIQKAQNDLKALSSNDPKYRNVQINDHIYLAQQYFGLGEMEKSKQEYLSALQFDSSYESALAGLALTYADAGDLPDARIILETALKNNPKNYNLWLQYVDIRKNLGSQNQELADIYKQALLATNNYPDILTRDAEFQESIGNLNEAVNLWKTAAEVNPDNKEIYLQEVERLSKNQ